MLQHPAEIEDLRVFFRGLRTAEAGTQQIHCGDGAAPDVYLVDFIHTDLNLSGNSFESCDLMISEQQQSRMKDADMLEETEEIHL